MEIPQFKINKRRPYDNDTPDGYLESDRDYMDNNADAVIWFLDNAKEIFQLLKYAHRTYEKEVKHD